MYHRHSCAKHTFNWIDHHIWKAIWIWCLRRHNNKGKKWVFKRYFTYHNGNRWTFFAKDDKTTHYLFKMATVLIRRYVKIKAKANPFVKEDEPAFELHLQRKMLNTWHKRKRLITIFRRQHSKCPMCNQPITEQSGWNIHHKLERLQGSVDSLDNLVMLYPDCHRQVHFWHIQFDGDVSITKTHDYIEVINNKEQIFKKGTKKTPLIYSCPKPYISKASVENHCRNCEYLFAEFKDFIHCFGENAKKNPRITKAEEQRNK